MRDLPVVRQPPFNQPQAHLLQSRPISATPLPISAHSAAPRGRRLLAQQHNPESHDSTATLHATTQPRAKDARAQTVEKGETATTAQWHFTPLAAVPSRQGSRPSLSQTGAQRQKRQSRLTTTVWDQALGAIAYSAVQTDPNTERFSARYSHQPPRSPTSPLNCTETVLRRLLHYLCRSPTSPLDARSCSVRLSRWGPGEFLVSLRFLC